MATLAVPIHDAEEAFNPNAVKVVMDAQGYALYFSRATIPGIAIALPTPARPSVIPCCVTSAFMAIAPALFAAMSAGRRARWSRLLEQLRVWYGEKIHVAVAAEVPGTGVDTPEDLERVRAELR
jgi:3-deoxy-manno-octulosonate cytidylyltransferase (CMP-KDO synthetase)